MRPDFVPLGPAEVISERPFTDPVDTLQDLDVLQYMLLRLSQIVGPAQTIPARPRPLVLFAQEPENRYHRIALARLAPLRRNKNLHVVGFCGHKRPQADRRLVDAIDEQLIAQFMRFPYLLSYSTLQLDSGDCCNLVLFSKRQGLAHWAKGETHAQAVALSPDYYRRIRLHNALLPEGLPAYQQLSLLYTKYIDYEGESTWAAVRGLPSPPDLT
jgi:hypothetical protein